MSAIAEWVSEQRRVYFDNAPMRREFRTQLRSVRAPWLMSGYLLLLVGMASIFYWGISSLGSGSAAGAQMQLNGFFLSVIGMLEFFVALAAPVIAASSIVAEYQTRMIDLVFSSPMSAKYFLVGKLVSSYRYVLLLLIVSLPIAAVSVVLGGATWSDVVSSYALVSLHGLLYMAISLPIAVMTGRAVPTVVYSYCAVGAIVIASLAGSVGVLMAGGRAVSPFAGLSPMLSGVVAGASTEVWGVNVPVLVTTALVVLLFVKIMVLGAGSVLTQAGSKESFSLRVHGLLACFLVSLVLAATNSSVPFGATSSLLPSGVFWLSLPFFIFVPYLATWSPSGGGKTWPNGVWSWKWALRGTPASGLPYLFALLASLCLGYAAGSIGKGGAFGVEAAVSLAGVFAFWGLTWAMGWGASAAAAQQTPEVARRLLLLFSFVVFIVPLVLLGMLEGIAAAARWGFTPGWTRPFNVLYFMNVGLAESAVKVGVLAGVALVIGLLADRKRRRVVEQVQGAS